MGHTTQICVLPGYQGHGLGRQLLQTSIEALGQHGYNALSLTVTSVNRSAVCLYERMGFRTVELRGMYEFMRCGPGGQLKTAS